MTPEERMEAALDAALEACEGASIVDEWQRIRDALYSHGAAAIEAALAEQRARVVAGLSWLAGKARASSLTGDAEVYETARTWVEARGDEAWAERTGRKQ